MKILILFAGERESSAPGSCSGVSSLTGSNLHSLWSSLNTSRRKVSTTKSTTKGLETLACINFSCPPYTCLNMGNQSP